MFVFVTEIFLVFIQICRQDFAAGGTKTTRGSTFFKYNIACMQQPWGQT